MVAIRVGPDMRTVVVGTADYFATHPIPVTPADLAAHNGVSYRLVGGGGLLAWEFALDGRATRVQPGGQLISNDAALASATVRAGAALGYMLEEDVAADVAAGHLIQVLDDWCPTFPGYHLYHPSRQATPALRALIEALRRNRRIAASG